MAFADIGHNTTVTITTFAHFFVDKNVNVFLQLHSRAHDMEIRYFYKCIWY